MPSWYVNRPVSVRGDSFYVAAFSSLSTDRQFPGNGTGPIPWSSAVLYAREYGLGAPMRRFFAQVILMLDANHREHLQEKRRQQEGKEARAAARQAKLAKDKTGGREKRRLTGNR